MLENVQRVRTIGRCVPVLLTVLAEKVVTGTLSQEVLLAGTSATKRTSVLEQVA